MPVKGKKRKSILPNKKERAAAAHDVSIYTNNNLSIPAKTSAIGIILESKHWYSHFKRKSIPESGDWLDEHLNDRKGQTFRSWHRPKRRFPSAQKDTIGLIVIGKFDINLNISNQSDAFNNEEKINDDDTTNQKSQSLFYMLTELVQTFYGMKVQIMPSIQSKDIKSRFNEDCGVKQLLTGSIHNKLSHIRRKTKELFCLMGVSIIDLYPRESWNFVFGQARMCEGTGVFSFARYLPRFDEIADDKDGELKLLKKLCNGKSTDVDILNKLGFDTAKQRLFFRRCIKVLVHEIGHLFGLAHCAYFECIMNGSNHLEESDSKPVYLCPVCLHKVYFCRLKHSNNDGYKPLDLLQRYIKLATFYEKYGLIDDAKWYQERVAFIQKHKC